MRRTHLLLALLVVFSALVLHRTSTAQAPARLEVELLSFRNDQGAAGCSLYSLSRTGDAALNFSPVTPAMRLR